MYVSSRRCQNGLLTMVLGCMTPVFFISGSFTEPCVDDDIVKWFYKSQLEIWDFLHHVQANFSDSSTTCHLILLLAPKGVRFLMV